VPSQYKLKRCAFTTTTSIPGVPTPKTFRDVYNDTRPVESREGQDVVGAEGNGNLAVE
jgi:hypothetical protein